MGLTAGSLATLNAGLNGLAAVLLLFGFLAIRRKKIIWHRRFMGSAFAVSILFLISYLIRFSLSGVHRFPGTGGIRTFYLCLLGTHTTLAAITPFLAIRTLFLALKARWADHRRWARITWPIWMYVSVTGVGVYWMLYVL